MQSLSMATEEAEYIRAAWAELHSSEPSVNTRDYNELVASVPGLLITDAKGVYDSIVRSVSSNLGLADKRSAVEALTISH